MGGQKYNYCSYHFKLLPALSFQLLSGDTAAIYKNIYSYWQYCMLKITLCPRPYTVYGKPATQIIVSLIPRLVFHLQVLLGKQPHLVCTRPKFREKYPV